MPQTNDKRKRRKQSRDQYVTEIHSGMPLSRTESPQFLLYRRPTNRKNPTAIADPASTIIIAPTEPTELKEIGVVGLLPERYGVDAIWHLDGMTGKELMEYEEKLRSRGLDKVPLMAGVQRKALGDLVNSLMEGGRLQKELAQMKQLEHKCLIVEGGTWTVDRVMMDRYHDFTKDQLEAMLWTCAREFDCPFVYTTSLHDTIATVRNFMRWSMKADHSSLKSRPKGPIAPWGSARNRDMATWILQGFPNIGWKSACAIHDAFDGVPLEWTVTEEQLRSVPGIGKGIAKQLIDFFRKGDKLC